MVSPRSASEGTTRSTRPAGRPREDELGRDAGRRERGQLDTRGGRQHPELNLGNRETSVLGGDDHVAGEHQLQGATEAAPLDREDHRKRESIHREDRVHELRDHLVTLTGQVLLHGGSGREVLAPCADDQHSE
jgi:hypothetical protein